VVLRALLLTAIVATNAAGQEQATGEAAKTPPAGIVIPNGTLVNLRFARAVWGWGGGWRPRFFHANKGDVVPLVVAEDVLLHGQVVIHKGSPAQATVDGIRPPPRDNHGIPYTCLCVSFEFNWVQSVDQQQLPLRGTAKAPKKIRGIELNVQASPSGAIAEPLSLGLGIQDVITLGMNKSNFHRRDWIPVGARTTAFLGQDSTLDAAEILEAQQNLPVPNENGVVMIYRTKGRNNDLPAVSCDTKTLAKIGSKQFVTLEMAPGEHSCQVEQSKALGFSVSGGHEYYLFLHYEMLTGNWGISAVDTEEGEDGVGAAEALLAGPPGDTSK